MVKMASRIGAVFGMDPVTVLRDGGDELLMQLRVAAYQVWISDERARNAKSTR